MHNLFVCRADTDKVVAFRTVISAPSVDERLSTTVGELDPGEYDVRVVAVASVEGSRGMSNPSPPARYVRARYVTTRYITTGYVTTTYVTARHVTTRYVTATSAVSVANIAPVVVGSTLVIGILFGVFFSSSIILTGEKLSVS